MNPVLRPVTRDDLETLLELTREYYAFDGLAFVPALARRALSELIGTAELGGAWLVEVDGGGDAGAPALAGYVVLTFGFIVEFHGRHAVIDELYLRPPFRGRGVGRAVLAWAEQLCRRRGCRALRLEVESDNHRARQVYTAAGFQAHDRVLLTKPLP